MAAPDRSWPLKIGVLAGHAACSALLSLAASPEFLNTFFIPNGFLTIYFLLSDRRWTAVGVIVACIDSAITWGIAHELQRSAMGHVLVSHAVVDVLANVGEALIAAALTRRLCGSNPDFGRLDILARFSFLCVLPAVCLATAEICLVLALAGQITPWSAVPLSIAGDFFGILIIAPGLWTIINQSTQGHFRRSMAERIALYSLLFFCEIGLFFQPSQSVLFIVFPCLVAISFRLGPVGTSYGIMGTGIVATIATVLGFGPFAANESASWGAHFLLQLFVLTASFTALPASGAVAEKERALERAEKAAAAKSAFLANMSHELRTPLNAVIGFSELMLNEIFGPLGNERYRNYLADIHRSGDHLLSLVNDVLDLSSVDAGKLELNESVVALGPLLDEATNAVSPKAYRQGLSLSAEVPAGLPDVRIDSRRIYQVLLNILSNAVKFTPAGGSVTATIDRDDNGLRIRIADTGIGIAKENIARVFERFGQVEAVNVREHQGTGLGMPISKTLVELHGGTLSLESVEHVGTTVTILLPASRIVLSEMKTVGEVRSAA